MQQTKKCSFILNRSNQINEFRTRRKQKKFLRYLE